MVNKKFVGSKNISYPITDLNTNEPTFGTAYMPLHFKLVELFKYCRTATVYNSEKLAEI